MKRSKVFLSRQQSRQVDQLAMDAGISGITLMENAGRGCVSKLITRGIENAVVCCGTGNNGGDGFVIARRLAILGIPVKILLCGDEKKISGDAKVNFEIAKNIDLIMKPVGSGWDQSQLSSEMKSVQGAKTDWVIDCMLGTGTTGDPRPPMDLIIETVNELETKRMAVDIPSGLDCDSGIAGKPTFRADLTCTFVAKKTGFQNPSAHPYLGEVKVITIGVPMSILEKLGIEDD